MIWQRAKLSEVADIERDGIASEAITTGTRYLGLEHIETGGKILSSAAVEAGDLASTKFRFTRKHVLYGKLRPYLAKIAMPDFDGICSTDIVPIMPGPNLDRSFLTHFLRQPAMIEFANSRTTGANLPRLSPKALADFEIPLPPIEEQKRIAAILDQADELRRKRQRVLDRLNQLGQAIFIEMFGDPLGDPNNGIGWTTEELESNVEFMDYRGKTPLKAESGIRLITARNVKMGFINLEPMEFVEADSYDSWMTRGFPKRGDILFTTEAPLGHVAQLDTDEKVVIGQRLITMKPNLRLIRPTYLEFFLRTPSFRRKMFENSTGSTVVGIKSKLLKKIEIRYPAGPHQDKFEVAIQQLRATGPHVAISSSRVNDLFVSLQHKAFRGELTASSLTEAAE